jgi:hypothetical protein
MFTLLQTFFDIALWRKGPQDLPASSALAVLVLFVYLGIEYLGVRAFGLSMRETIVLTAAPVIMLAIWSWSVLAFFGRRQRFVQTITAALGVGVLLVLLDIGVRTLQLSFGVPMSETSSWPFAYFFIFALVMGRIFMHALDRGLLTGIALTVAIIYSTAEVEEVARLVLHRLQAS